MLKNEITHVVLDLGEVLIRLDFSSVLEALNLPKDLPLSEGLLQMDAWERYDQFERGTITEEAFFSPSPALRRVWNSVLVEAVPEAEEILQGIRKKARLFALTNTNLTHIQHAVLTFPVLNKFEKIYSSCDLGARKPERKIYERVQEEFDTRPEKVLFIDDREENVEGARAFGWKAELCKNSPTDLKKALRKHGVL